MGNSSEKRQGGDAMSTSEERIKMIGRMAESAGLIEDPQWLLRLEEPVPLWVVLDLMLKWIDRAEPPVDGPFD
jgi:hypothetical protein